MTEQQTIEREYDVRDMKNRAGMIAAGLIFLAFVLAFCATAHAQTTCVAGGATTCLGATKTAGEAPLATTVIWNAVGASSCTAGGAGSNPAWSGTVATSGSKNLSGINLSMTLTLDCVAPATAGKMRLTWTPPTQNTNGTPLTDLGGYYIDYGTAAGALNQTISLAVPGASAYDVTGLAAGTWFAQLRAATLSCFPSSTANCHVSLPSATVSKAVTTTPGGALPQLSVTLDPYTVPKPPTGVVATDVTAFAIEQNQDGTLVAKRVNLNPISTNCDDARCTVVASRQ